MNPMEGECTEPVESSLEELKQLLFDSPTHHPNFPPDWNQKHLVGPLLYAVLAQVAGLLLLVAVLYYLRTRLGKKKDTTKALG